MGLLHLAVFGDFGHRHRIAVDLADPGIGDPADVALAQLRLHQPLGVADAVQPHVPDVRLGRDVGHRHTVAQATLAQILVENHRELVGRTEAAGARRGPMITGPGDARKA
jgi:hypothetical protein